MLKDYIGQRITVQFDTKDLGEVTGTLGYVGNNVYRLTDPVAAGIPLNTELRFGSWQIVEERHNPWFRIGIL